MVMDPGIRQLPGVADGFRFGDHLPNQNGGANGYSRFEGITGGAGNGALGYNPLAGAPGGNSSHSLPPVACPPFVVPAATGDDDSLELSEIFSDIALGYISKMLMEEDMEDKVYMNQGDSALVAAEKPFYDCLRENFPVLSPDQHPLYPDNHESPDDSSGGAHYNIGSAISGVTAVDNSWVSDIGGEVHLFSPLPTGSVDYSSQSSFSSSHSNCSDVVNAIPGPQMSSRCFQFEELFAEIQQPDWQCQFKRGVEEANKFLPDTTKLVINLESQNGLLLPLLPLRPPRQESKKENRLIDGKAEEGRGRKNPYHEDLDLAEGRNVKQTAVYAEEEIRSKMFDEVLLCHHGQCKDAISTLREALQSEVSKSAKNGSASKGSNGGKSRGRRQAKKEVVDLRTLLIHCAQSVAADDRRSANELLKQIRQHSSESGDGSQRLAKIFADGLEARLAGTGSQMYHTLLAKRQSATDILKAYHLYLAACPFKKISHFFANQTILNVAEKATRLHIIDFGIYFGFQWPCLIQRLASRPNGPPKLRITGIDVPQPGFRPTERIEETGRRLDDYCRSFKVPFEYHPIATKWESIQIEDLKIDRDEVLIVNCLYRFRNLVDETVVVDSPRNIVLNNIRRMNPDVLIHGVMNGSYSAPFFVTRFREALFHYSALFDMLDTTVPREKPERLLIEKEIFGREAMNVVACEGSERVERPETYKQWQVRNLRAGFRQLPLDENIKKKAKDKVRSCYHKDFVIDEDSKWLLQGWKGRIIYALSTWVPSGRGF